MTRPHPIIGVAAELADRLRGRTDQTHIGELLDNECEEPVAAEKRIDLDDHAGILSHEPFGQRLAVFVGDLLVFILSGRRGDVAEHIGRNVHDPADEPHGKPGSGQLLGLRHGPETVLQVVVLDGRKLLNGTEPAVVVGEQQSLGGDDLTRTTVAEDNDGILERRLVDAVNILGGEFATPLFHLPDIHLLKVGQEPHALVGESRNRCGQSREQQKKSLHKPII